MSVPTPTVAPSLCAKLTIGATCVCVPPPLLPTLPSLSPGRAAGGCTIAVGTGSDPVKVKQYAKENLDLFGFALTPAEIKLVDAMAKPDGQAPGQYTL
eukprot:SAG22_NODE_3_length_48349_cov_158.681180_10_plen_98_part_00